VASRDILQRRPELTALFCYNDLVAVGALQACAELGRHVPGDIAIVGYDDVPLAALVSPSLTTCRVPRTDLGSLAVQALIDRLRDCPTGCQPIILEPELVLRSSAP
jgi:LacI family transcriptional regulator